MTSFDEQTVSFCHTCIDAATCSTLGPVSERCPIHWTCAIFYLYRYNYLLVCQIKPERWKKQSVYFPLLLAQADNEPRWKTGGRRKVIEETLAQHRLAVE